MKIILTICILIGAFTCSAQTEKKGDTLIIKDWQAYKFIKIGDKVYQINSPTISETVVPQLPLLWNGLRFFGGGTTLLSNDSDTLRLTSPGFTLKAN